VSDLSRYREKRYFRRTPEPRGRKGRPRKSGLLFVIQRHAARVQHYDLRLEIGGVLASWSVPKGPSTDPRDRRLAIQTEDHPLQYADFEGRIPAGEYGGGVMIIWDRGQYRNLREGTDMADCRDEGRIDIRLEGEKLTGAWSLRRTGGQGERSRWLLLKRKGDGADARRDPLRFEPQSVVSGRTLEELLRPASGGSRTRTR
jgi:DNA ligase D-like protein (predicted 3'-phosphoesterase)